MKTLKFVLVLVLPLTIMACRQGSNKQAVKNEDSTALLLKNAKVEGQEPQKVEDFVQEAALGGLMEVELGRYAEQNAVNPRVKNFGAMMVRDHSKANDELKTIASGKNITIPAVMDNNHQNKVDDLKKKTGADFDKSYMDEMVDDHDKDVDKFKKQAENGTDPEIKAFATKTLEVLLVHQDSAKQIKDALKR
jgi:putative membrane protein